MTVINSQPLIQHEINYSDQPCQDENISKYASNDNFVISRIKDNGTIITTCNNINQTMLISVTSYRLTLAVNARRFSRVNTI